MAETLKEFVIELGVDADSEELSQFDEAVNDLKSSLSSLAKIGGAAIGVIGGAGATVFEMTRRTAQAGEEALLMSERLGVTVEQAQKLDFVAQKAGQSGEEMQDVMKELQLRAAEASNGTGQAVEAFDRLGISLRNSNGQIKSGIPLLKEASARLSEMGDRSMQVATAEQLFGEAGTRLLPVLNGQIGTIDELTTQAEELGIAMGQQAAEESREFQRSLRTLQFVIGNIRQTFGTKFLPIFNRIIDGVVRFVQKNNKLIDQKLDEFIGFLAIQLGKLNDWIEQTDFSGISFQDFVDSVKTTAQVFSTLIALFTAGKIASAIVSIISLVSTLGSVLSALGGITGILGGLSSAFAGLSSIMGAIITAGSTLASVVGSALAALSAPVLAVIAALAAAGVAVWVFWDEIVALGDAIGDLFAAIGDLILFGFEKAFNGVVALAEWWFRFLFNTILAPFKDEINLITSLLQSGFRFALENIKGFFSSIFSSIESIVFGSIEWVKEQLGSLTDSIESAAAWVNSLTPDDDEAPGGAPPGGGMGGPGQPPAPPDVGGATTNQEVSVGGNTVVLESSGNSRRDRERARRTAKDLQRRGVKQARTVFESGER